MTEIEHMDAVDADERAHRPTEGDEAQQLRALYGPPDEAGIYRGEEVAG